MIRQMLSAVCKELLELLILGLASESIAQDAGDAINKALAVSHRSDADRARDKYCHPKETLLFFGFRPDMTVVEIWPTSCSGDRRSSVSSRA